jgi:hypothetical protein
MYTYICIYTCFYTALLKSLSHTYMKKQVSDYQAFVNVGGNNLWMNLDTGTSTSWVMTVACFTETCKETKLFSGVWWPAFPPLPTIIDLLQRGFFQIGAMLGLLGHSPTNLAGSFVLGCPMIIGFLDLGDVIGGMSYNHTGAIGLGELNCYFI